MKSSFISSLLRLVRKTILVLCLAGLIAFLAVWMIFACPEKSSRLLDKDRISVVQWMGSGTNVYLRLGTKHPMPYKGTIFPFYRHKAVLAITKTSTTVSWNSTYDAPQALAENGIRFAGFKAVHSVQHAEGHPPYLLWYISRTVTVPVWFPIVVLSPYPTWALFIVPLRRRRRKRKGLCLRCGYDLTGNVSGSCSECGMATPHTAMFDDPATPTA